MFAMDSTATPYSHENAAIFALSAISFPILLFVTWKYAKDTQYYNEEGVIVPLHVRTELSHSAEESGKSTSVELVQSNAGNIKYLNEKTSAA